MAIPIGAIVSAGGQAVSFLSKLFGSGSSSVQEQRLNRDDTKWLYDQQSNQWRANTEWYNQNGYSMLREGLESAGYNPLLALDRQPLNGATVEGSAVDNTVKSRQFSIPQAFAQTSAMLRNTNADTALKYAQVEENISRSALENAETVLKNKEVPYKDKQLALGVIESSLRNSLYRSQISNVSADTTNKISATNLTNAQIRQLNANIELLKNQKIISDKAANFYLKHPKQAAAAFGVGLWTGAIGNVFGGNFNAGAVTSNSHVHY